MKEMNIKTWNVLQVEAFREHNVTSTVDVYRYGSLISHLRSVPFQEAKDEIDRIIRKGQDKNNEI